jgi:7-keto-8-aminopelargonate synthetase-like enzyme
MRGRRARVRERARHRGRESGQHRVVVVPQGQARLRCQISAAHTREHLDRAIQAISEIALNA